MSALQSDYLQHLPQIFRTETHGSGALLGEFLKVFEAMLAGRNDAVLSSGERVRGLEELIDAFVEYLDPALTPTDGAAAGGALDSEFLDYLARWVALTLDQNWPLAQKREWLRQVVPLYKRRGTRDGLVQYLRMFIGDGVTVEEPTGEFVIDSSSTVGVDTYLGGAPAYFFWVIITYGYPPEPFEIEQWQRIRTGTGAVVDLEKPAHTYYEIKNRAAGFIVDQRSTIGFDTLLWTNTP